MLLKIIPLTRLPRSLGLFDYLAPKEIEDQLQPGQLVTIPWRQSGLFGLIFSLAESATGKIGGLKKISRIVHAEPLVSKTHLDYLHTISQWYGVSLATLAPMSLLPLQKKKLAQFKPSPLSYLPSQKVRLQTTDYRLQIYQNHQSHALALSSAISGSTLILLPQIHLIDEIHKLLSLEQQGQTVVWHSQLTEKQQFERWRQIRNGEKTIILGTRGAILLPIPNLKTIIIDYEHDENHKHWDQAPRFHVKDVATLLAKITGASLHLMSYSPGVDSYALSFVLDSPFRGNDIRVIDMRAERRAGRFGVMADEVKEAIIQTKGDMFLFINRLGFSTSVGCSACGYVTRCERCQLPLIYHQKTNSLRCHYCQTETKITYDCPVCKNRVVQLRGAGTEFVEVGVRKLLGDNIEHEVMRIDSERTEGLLYTTQPRIIVGTRMAWRHVRWEKTEVIVYVGIDSQLSIPEYRATEAVWHTVQETLFRKTATARLYIQTFNPDHLLFKSLREPDRFHRTELNSRRSLGYPPYQYLVRYFYGNRDARLAQREARRVYSLLKSHLTKGKKSANISQAIEMHPRFYRNQFWQAIIIRLDPKTWPEDLVWLNQFIPATWKIDPNPLSLLSP